MSTSRLTTIDDIMTETMSLSESVGRAVQFDMDEAQRALRRAKWWSCSKKKAIKRRMDDVPPKVQRAEDDLSGTLEQFYAPKSAALSQLVEQEQPSWTELAAGIGRVQDQVKQQLQLETWTSPGADAYKRALPAQQNALAELRKMAENGAKAAEYLAMINAYIHEVVVQSVRIVTSEVHNIPAPPEPPDYLVAHNNEVDFGNKYFVRSEKAAAMLRGLSQWCRDLSTPESAWGPTAFRLRDTLTQMMGSTANLGKGGAWPESVAGQPQEVSVLDLSELQESMRAIATSEADATARRGGGNGPTRT
ncbi:hypothetical protein ACSDQ9_03000 [Aestuariimicrobium soli]|uniref:hypothetical protein n=1 Tax=Aestuariimicrobium soli TaxID=2035834 RepID=UPI003EB69613